MAPDRSKGGDSAVTVLLALAVNLAIAVMKAIAGVITGSAAMMSEAAHSVAGTFTEALLLTALRRSARPADRRHPFGYGKDRYFWSLLAAVSIFVSGAVFAFYEGFRTVFGAPEEQNSPVVGYACWPSRSRWSRCRGRRPCGRCGGRRGPRSGRCSRTCGCRTTRR